ncbi:hypothetical protein ACK2M7_12760 [Chryseobacterium sp. TY4]
MEDEVEFRQTGSYPVYYEREFPHITREICVYLDGGGKWKASVCGNDGNVLYYLTELGVLKAIQIFEKAEDEASKLMQLLRKQETTLDKV